MNQKFIEVFNSLLKVLSQQSTFLYYDSLTDLYSASYGSTEVLLELLHLALLPLVGVCQNQISDPLEKINK